MMVNPELTAQSQMGASEVKLSEMLLDHFEELFLPTLSLSASDLQIVADAFCASGFKKHLLAC
jgi:hypothetical protein